MRLATRLLAASAASLIATAAIAHDPARGPRDLDPNRAIVFPDTAQHQTLVVDLHTHSAFSDGHVWPGIRVAEAIADGLDAIAITEHLEWQPHLPDVPHPDRNRAYEIAADSVPDGEDLIVINGSEITRQPPHGHINAVFIEDANPLVRPGEPPEPFDAVENYIAAMSLSAEDAVRAANDQDAFVFWNHSWSDFRSNQSEATEFHQQAAAAGQLHGIEIANGQTYSPESFQIALDLGLTPVGVSDVHNLIDWDYTPHKGGHRPVNLVFAEERNADAIQAALMAGRTVVWFRNQLLGLAEHLQPLLDASMTIKSAGYPNENVDVLEVVITNGSDAEFELQNRTAYTMTSNAHIAQIAPHSDTTLRLRTGERLADVTLHFRVLNALTTPDSHPEVAFQLTPTGVSP